MSQQHQQLQSRPRNLGRGISKPKKNTVASLLAQSRAQGSPKPSPLGDFTDDDNSDSNSNSISNRSDLDVAEPLLQPPLPPPLTDLAEPKTVTSHLVSSKPPLKALDEKQFLVPFEYGWKRETIMRGLTKSGNIKGEVYYIPPDDRGLRIGNISDLNQVILQKLLNFIFDLQNKTKGLFLKFFGNTL